MEQVIEKLHGYEVPNSRYPLDWTVQSPLEKHEELPNGDYEEKCLPTVIMSKLEDRSTQDRTHYNLG